MMTETETEAVNDETPIKPGTLLKQKRESLGLTQKQIADKLRLRVTVVEALESNNFNIDKVSTFVRGYIRSYARLVGVDEPQILAAYDEFCGTEPQELSMTSFSNKTVRQQHNSRHNLITLGIILIVIGISSVWWYQSQKDDTLSPQNKSHSNPTNPTNPTAAKAPMTSSTSDDGFTTVSDLPPAGDNTSGVASESEQQQEQGTSSQPEDKTDQATVGKADASDATAAPLKNKTSGSQGKVVANDATTTVASRHDEVASKAPQDAASDMSALSMSFQNDCWIRVKDANDQTIVVGLKKAGQKINLQGKAPFKLILGAPEGVSITFAGEPVDLSRYTSGKVARFTLP